MPSTRPLLILERNQRRMPSQCFLMVFAASMTGWRHAAGGPGAPLAEVDLRQPGREIPERLEAELDPVGEGRLQTPACRIEQFVEPLALPGGELAASLEPQIAGAVQLGALLAPHLVPPPGS